ncbi:hypothetical protein FM106_06705 [Brachybacterium faecium]|nr:hypothetical protein FM106_06705 [Brachybacterium faecium]SOB96805.1 hypothetical protein BTH160X_10031 [Brochothrix thermosphacta]
MILVKKANSSYAISFFILYYDGSSTFIISRAPLIERNKNTLHKQLTPLRLPHGT